MQRLCLFLTALVLTMFSAPGSLQAQEAVPASIPEVQYPNNSRAEGVVSIVGLLNSKGDVEESRIVSGFPSLNQEALRSVLRWKFQPLTEQNLKTPFPVSIHFIFSRSGIGQAIEKTKMAPVGPYLPPLPVVFSGAETTLTGEGFVVVQLSINPAGSVTRAQMVKYCKVHPNLDEACLKAAGKWKFEPGRQGGSPVPSTTYICFVYKALPAKP